MVGNSQHLAVRQRETSVPEQPRVETTRTASRRPSRVRNNDDDNSDGSDDLYDPCQPIEERRRVQRGFRDLLRGVTENSEDYLQTGSRGLTETILKATELSKQFRQTTEATIDSRLLVSTTDLSYKKALRLTQGSLSQGIDVDEFVSKCATYMRQGASMQEERDSISGPNRLIFDEDDDTTGDDGDMMDWPHLGTMACLPSLRRPALAGFLIGPLSLERRIRKISKRTAPFRPNNLVETRPEVLNIDDLAKRENDLTAICRKILEQLVKTQIDIQEAVAKALTPEMDDDEKQDIMHSHGLRSTGGIDLMRFVVNPKSFGQTIENLFYISFLIRDGRVEVDFDDYSLPAIGKHAIPSSRYKTLTDI